MKRFSLIALIALAGFSQIVQAAVTVAPFRIEESRSVSFGDDNVSRTPPSLKVVFIVTGPEADASVRYGDLKLDEAVDDKGTSLIPGKDSFNDPAEFKEYSNAFFRNSKFGDKSKPVPAQIEVALAQPKRTATKIARLRGTFSLASAGTIRTVELAGLKGPGPKTLAIPAAAHLTVSVKAAAGDDANSLGVEITGDENALESLEVMDGSGRKVSSGMSSWSVNGGPVKKSISLEKPLDNSMKLVAKISMDRKLVKVPFDLKDIALP